MLRSSCLTNALICFLGTDTVFGLLDFVDFAIVVRVVSAVVCCEMQLNVISPISSCYFALLFVGFFERTLRAFGVRAYM